MTESLKPAASVEVSSPIHMAKFSGNDLEDSSIQKPKFSIISLLDNKSSHAISRSESTDEREDTPTSAPFDSRMVFPPFAAFLQPGLLPAGIPPQVNGLIAPGHPFLPWMAMLAKPEFTAQSNAAKEMSTSSISEKSDLHEEEKPGEARNSTGGSPIESDVEDYDDEQVDGDDDSAVDAGGSNRKKKTRTVFSRHQVSQLEMMFDLKRYLNSTERAHLARRLNLTETQVKIWFQNRRNKFKRQAQSDDANANLQIHRASLFGPIQADRIPALPNTLNILPIPTVSSPVTLRSLPIPPPIDPAAAARLLFGYAGLAAVQAQQLM